MSLETVKVGPWGGSHGTPRDISRNSKPQRLETITIFSTEGNGGRVYGLSFEYVDQKNQNIPVSTIGSKSKGKEEMISLGETQYVYHVSGTMDVDGVTSLKFLTSTGMEYGPYGYQSGNEFSLPLDQDQGQVVAFFGRSTESLVALGMYVLTGTTGVVKVGPWGPAVGTARNPPSNVPRQLMSITIYSTEVKGEHINGLSFEYLDKEGQTITVGPWGSTKGFVNRITLANKEYVNYISGTTDEKGVTSLDIKTTTGANYGTFGHPAGTAFSLPMNHGNGTALSFFGRANGNCLVALGTYLGPRA